MMILADGKKVSEKILEEIKEKINEGKAAEKLKFSIILANQDQPSRVYTSIKKKKAEEVGIECDIIEFSTDCKVEDVIFTIDQLNSDSTVHGILVQLPLFEHLDHERSKILSHIKKSKDIDRLSAVSLGDIFFDQDAMLLPATPQAVIECLNHYNLNEWKGKNVVIINNSNLVGLPLTVYFSKLGSTVSCLNEHTEDIQKFTREADLLISATGQTNLIDHTMVKNGVVLVDVTSKKIETKVRGDIIRSKEIDEKASFLTPVPNGIGPVTVACLLRNLVLQRLGFK